MPSPEQGKYEDLPINQSINETPTEPVEAKIPDGVEKTAY